MKRSILGIIDLYRKYISPLLSHGCRYYPTCSQYAVDAVEKYGAMKGTAISAGRILRCNQFFKGGFDPVK